MFERYLTTIANTIGIGHRLYIFRTNICQTLVEQDLLPDDRFDDETLATKIYTTADTAYETTLNTTLQLAAVIALIIFYLPVTLPDPLGAIQALLVIAAITRTLQVSLLVYTAPPPVNDYSTPELEFQLAWNEWIANAPLQSMTVHAIALAIDVFGATGSQKSRDLVIWFLGRRLPEQT